MTLRVRGLDHLVLRVKDEETILHEGDSFLFDSLLPHSFRNPTDALALPLCSPASKTTARSMSVCCGASSAVGSAAREVCASSSRADRNIRRTA